MSTEHPSQPCGQLEKDAPGLYASLGRRSNGESLPLFETCYSISFKYVESAEAPVKRAPGASFNPRAARICSILLKEFPAVSENALLAALLVTAAVRGCLPREVDESQVEAMSALKGALSTAFLAAELVENPLPHADTDARLVALSYQIDLLRHLHMTDLPENFQADHFAFAREKVLSILATPDTGRLRVLLKSLVERYERQAGC